MKNQYFVITVISSGVFVIIAYLLFTIGVFDQIIFGSANTSLNVSHLANDTASKYGIFPHETDWYVHVTSDGKIHHDSAQLPGSQIVKSGIGSQVTVGKIISISSGLVITNLNPVGGDSGSPVFKPLVDGTANVYGIITEAAGGGIYLTWDNMQAGLNLTG